MSKKTTITLIFLSCLALLLFASSCTYTIKGVISHKSGDTVKVKGYTFLVPQNTLKEGQVASFTKTLNKQKANSKKIN